MTSWFQFYLIIFIFHSTFIFNFFSDIKALLQLSSYVANLEKKNLKVDMNSGTGTGIGVGTNGPSTTTGNKKSNIHNP